MNSRLFSAAMVVLLCDAKEEEMQMRNQNESLYRISETKNVNVSKSPQNTLIDKIAD
jgi:hypothetical protein